MSMYLTINFTHILIVAKMTLWMPLGPGISCEEGVEMLADLYLENGYEYASHSCQAIESDKEIQI